MWTYDHKGVKCSLTLSTLCSLNKRMIVKVESIRVIVVLLEVFGNTHTHVGLGPSLGLRRSRVGV